MTLRQANQSLSLVSEFPGAESLAWRVEELYQRDIDWGRVQRQIVPYLQDQSQPQFFNSLTVALLPIFDGQVRNSFEGTNWAPPPLLGEDKFDLVKIRGPFKLGYWGSWQSSEEPGAKLGQIRWNTSQVFGIAIDGQHRLAAIKEYAKAKDKDASLDKTQIPVILLVLDEELGYYSPKGKPIVDVLRKLFIDLNKHAVRVSRSRQILLDDKDPHALCVRALVGRQVMEGDGDLRQSPPRLPLSLVDWHSDSARFDKGPYLATILGLDWIVTTVLGSPPTKDYTDYTAIGRQLRAFKNELGVPLTNAFERLTELAN